MGRVNEREVKKNSQVANLRNWVEVLPFIAVRGVACSELEKDFQDSVTHHPSVLPVFFLQGSF